MAFADIELFYETHRDLAEYLVSKGEPTFAIEANNNFRRSLVLAIASHFEYDIAEIMRGIALKHANGRPIIRDLIENRVIARQYHSYFDWEKKNANKFFSMFGDEFRSKATTRVSSDSDLDKSIKDFLELGNTRNRLVHLNYVDFDVDKTPADIIALFRSAQRFIDFLREELLA